MIHSAPNARKQKDTKHVPAHRPPKGTEEPTIREGNHGDLAPDCDPGLRLLQPRSRPHSFSLLVHHHAHLDLVSHRPRHWSHHRILVSLVPPTTEIAAPPPKQEHTCPVPPLTSHRTKGNETPLPTRVESSYMDLHRDNVPRHSHAHRRRRAAPSSRRNRIRSPAPRHGGSLHSAFRRRATHPPRPIGEKTRPPLTERYANATAHRLRRAARNLAAPRTLTPIRGMTREPDRETITT